MGAVPGINEDLVVGVISALDLPANLIEGIAIHIHRGPAASNQNLRIMLKVKGKIINTLHSSCLPECLCHKPGQTVELNSENI